MRLGEISDSVKNGGQMRYKTKGTAFYTAETVKQSDKPIISARIRPATVKRLDNYCQTHSIPFRQTVIEQALDKYLK